MGKGYSRYINIRADEKIRAVLPDVQQAALLQIPVSTPLLSVEHIAFT